MPLISDVEKRSAKARMIYVIIYLLLMMGSVTMIYPMMIMLSSSVSSQADYEQYNVLPYYLWDDNRLWQKYVCLKYDEDFAEFKHRYEITDVVGDFRFYSGVVDPAALTPAARAQARDWAEFTRSLPPDRADVFFTNKYRLGPTQIEYQDWLAERFGTVQRYNLAINPPGVYRYFNDVEYGIENLLGHNWPPFMNSEKEIWLEFKRELAPEKLRALDITFTFQKFLNERYATIALLNAALKTDFPSLFDIEFTQAAPENPGLRALWLEFIHTRYPLRYVRVPGDHTAAFKRHLLSMNEFRDDPKAYDEVVRNSSANPDPADYFENLTWAESMPATEFKARLWADFLDTLAPEQIEFWNVRADYRQFLMAKYGALDGINQTWGTAFAALEQIRPPYREADMLHFMDNKNFYRRYFLISNYTNVIKYIYTNGHALKNTIILVVLWVLGSLTVQPMAAYALSRFNLSYANRVLLFLIATMSFPHSVTMIPNFLLLKNLHLLNTYAALILPNLVQGMGIFLLKGYFDSLPRELYEAGMIDGASEFQMFTRITLPLSTPILAVIALQSFTAAYGSFMWAFLICQKESMWTLMVFLYQFRQIAPPYTHMAALVVAGVPTLIIFILAQRVIMRGIVIPTMK